MSETSPGTIRLTGEDLHMLSWMSDMMAERLKKGEYVERARDLLDRLEAAGLRHTSLTASFIERQYKARARVAGTVDLEPVTASSSNEALNLARTQATELYDSLIPELEQKHGGQWSVDHVAVSCNGWTDSEEL